MVSIADPERLHRLLAASHSDRLNPSAENGDWERALQREFDIRLIEHRFVEAERREVASLAAKVHHDPSKFVRWFESLEQEGPGQHDPLFPWLAAHASYDQMCWFLSQEVAGEAGFEDLVALTQVKLPERAKLEMARNYWDEMGQGSAAGMHGPMLSRLARALGLRDTDETVWESLALGNLMVALAMDRHYAYQSVGALGVIELTAPGRAKLVNAGLKRLGVPGMVRQYFALHATLDVRHSAAWNAEVLAPLVEQNPEAAHCIAEGALLRLRAGARCFERYRRELWSSRFPIQLASA
ncbi:MAG TPA: iron-containing redox enzyme family protein [Polyangiaceae bacterium]|nr:iron-containing redox enzyme family protein [Polyangiaceae bacterium]